MTIEESSIISGSTIIKTYVENGINYSAAGIEEKDQYLVTVPIAANSTIWFRVKDNFALSSMWLLAAIGSYPSGSLSLSIFDLQRTTENWKMSMTMNNGNATGNGFFYQFIGVDIPKDSYIKLIIPSALESLLLSGKRIGKINQYGAD